MARQVGDTTQGEGTGDAHRVSVQKHGLGEEAGSLQAARGLAGARTAWEKGHRAWQLLDH